MPTIAMLTDRLFSAATGAEVAEVCLAFLHARGVVMGSYHHLPPVGAFDAIPTIEVATSGFPLDWVAFYRRNRLYEVDPIPRHAMSAVRPFWWSETARFDDNTSDERAYLLTLRRAKLGDGLAVPVFGPKGRDGYVGLGFGQLDRLPSQMQVARLQLCCQLGHLRYCEILLPEMPRPVLSGREREVLHWMVRGKSNAVIGTIIGLSANTIDTYVRRIYAKLRVNDRITAVLRGLALGLAGNP